MDDRVGYLGDELTEGDDEGKEGMGKEGEEDKVGWPVCPGMGQVTYSEPTGKRDEQGAFTRSYADGDEGGGSLMGGGCQPKINSMMQNEK